MDNRDIDSIRDIEKLDRVMQRTYAQNKPAQDNVDKMMRDMSAWLPWVAAIVLLAFTAWAIGAYVNHAVMEAVERLGGAL